MIRNLDSIQYIIFIHKCRVSKSFLEKLLEFKNLKLLYNINQRWYNKSQYLPKCFNDNFK